MPVSPIIEITYCRLCGWGLRAGWMAQELLTTFAEELGSVTLTPDRTGGVFEVRIDDEVIWSRKERGRFPEIKEGQLWWLHRAERRTVDPRCDRKHDRANALSGGVPRSWRPDDHLRASGDSAAPAGSGCSCLKGGRGRID